MNRIEMIQQQIRHGLLLFENGFLLLSEIGAHESYEVTKFVKLVKNERNSRG